MDDIKNKINRILEKERRCLCGHREWCEVCDPHSQFNQLREEIYTVVNGPRPKPTLEDYGRIVEINLSHLLEV